MATPIRSDDVFGLLRPAIDAHTLGLISVGQLLDDCGYRVVVGGADVCEAAGSPEKSESMALLESWIREHHITRLGFSYRLDPRDGADAFGRLLRQLERRALLAAKGGPMLGVYFAGPPQACELVAREHGDRVVVFCGDETPGETLDKLGVPRERRPKEMTEEIAYDDFRLTFGRDLVCSGKHLEIGPVDRSGCPGFGTEADLVLNRVRHSAEHGLPPLMRAHVGPYLPDRLQAVQLFLDWTRQLAAAGLLDVLSIGTSQLSQSHFGEEWRGLPNGGGVPINSREEFRAVWDASRPMLVRTYAGTNNIPSLARMYEDTIHIAWHALSLWWFSQIDGRGPHSVLENLEQHVETLRFIAESGKPFEPNAPHHFAFRGADDVTHVVSAVLAARTAKSLGIRRLVLQNMLNTPKSTWGVQDLAKSRAMLALTRELQDDSFRVILQPRAGLDYFSPDLEKAKVQLAAVSALMDDIEPNDASSPPIIHVLSYSEGSHLADPPVVNESIQITRAAIAEYRRLRKAGEAPDMARHPEVARRAEELLSGTRAVLRAVEQVVPAPYSAEGLYEVFRLGFLRVPHLWECREEFANAVRWNTRVIRGSVKVADTDGHPISAADRSAATVEAARGGKALRLR